MTGYWFADFDDEADIPPYVWQPCLETGHGHIPTIDVWFQSKAICEEWIRENVIGAELKTDGEG